MTLVTEIHDVDWDYLCENGYVPTALRNKIQRAGREDEAMDIVEEECGFVANEDDVTEFISEELPEIMGIDLENNDEDAEFEKY